MKELVSIIVPIYKVESYISVCVESLLKQTLKNIEIILVCEDNNGNSTKICEYYKNKNKNVKVVKVKEDSKENLKNVGLKHAKGKYVSFVDGGDTVSKDYIEYMLKLMVNEEADAVFTSFYVKGTKPKKAAFYDVYKKKNIMSNYMEMKFKSHFYAKLYKKELFDELEYPEVKYYDDFMLGYKIFDNIKVLVNSTIENYCMNPEKRVHKDRITDYDRMKKIGSCFDMLTFVEEKYPNLVNDCKTKICYESIDLFTKVSDRDYKKQLYSYVKLYRKYAINDEKIPFSKKMLCMRSVLGYGLMKLSFDIEKLLKRPV